MSTGPGRPPAGGTTIAAPHPDRPVDTQAILDERARVLARPARAEQIGELVALVAFAIGGVRHAFEARFVREVVPGPDVSTVPSAPPAVVGVINVRGEILTVADISALLGVVAPPARGPVVVLDGPAPSLGVLVDEVHDFVNLPAEAIAPLPGDGGPGERTGTSLVLGASPDAVVLSADAVLRDPRLSAADPRSDR